MRTRAVPVRQTPIFRAAARDKSRMRPGTKGPRSEMVTTTDLLFDKLVTRTTVPMGRVRWAAVMPFSS